MIQRIWPQILEAYGKELSHTFLVHQNVSDLTAMGVFGYMPLADALLWSVAQLGEESQRWLVFEYDRTEGATFPERMQLRGNHRANWQKDRGLDASLYKYAQTMAVNRNHRVALRTLRRLAPYAGFVDLMKQDSGNRKPFASLRGNAEFEEIVKTAPSIAFKQLNDGVETKNSGIGRDIAPHDLVERLRHAVYDNPIGMRVGVVIKKTELLLPRRQIGGVDLVSDSFVAWAADERIRARRNILILLTEDIEQIDRSFRDARGVCEVRAPMPNANERRQFIRQLSTMPPHWQPVPPPKDDEEKRSEEYQKMAREWPEQYDDTQIPDAMRFEPGMDRQTAAERCAGLRLIDIYDAHLNRAMVSQPISREDLDDARLNRVGIYTHNVLELRPGDLPEEHAPGLEHANRYFASIAARLYEGDPGMPVGVWLVGAPGSGKSTALRLFASAHGLPVFRVSRPAELAGYYLEESEALGSYLAALRSALRYAEAVAPAALELDSVERWVRQSNAQALAALLDVARSDMSRGRLFLVARVSNPSLLTYSRLTMTDMDALAFFPPTAKDRAAILRAVLLQQGLSFDKDLPFEELARLPEANGLNGGDLAMIASRAAERAREKERGRISELLSANEARQAAERAQILRRNPIDKEDLEQALTEYSPGIPEQETRLASLQAAMMSTARSHLPDEIDPPLAQIVLDNGRIAKQRIMQHVREIMQNRRRTGR